EMHTRVFPARAAVYKEPASPAVTCTPRISAEPKYSALHPSGRSYERGAVRQGENIILTTPTASGKTLAYTLPVLEKLMQNRDATAQFIYPTKTLTRDQLAVL
ncbi:MAG: DEAD/DEAH box helicase, partial [Methanocorpusculum sp.]|nr:DEAD/DEAH box helicase [Methanocorpusculum sp.]